MALKVGVAPPAFPGKARELITPIQNPHRVKIYSLLKPWHPFFVFEVLTEDLNGSLSFRISLKDIESKGKKTLTSFPHAQVIGVFPWGSCPGEPSDKYDQFQAYVFECLTRLIDDCLGKSTQMPRHMLQLVVGSNVNWTRVCRYLELLTDPLSPWFDRGTTVENGRLHFLLTQTQALRGDEPVCGWWEPKGGADVPTLPILPIDVANISVSAIEKEAQELGAKAETTLKRYLLEQAVNALYYMRFQI
jgi:hypothetical protein